MKGVAFASFAPALIISAFAYGQSYLTTAPASPPGATASTTTPVTATEGIICFYRVDASGVLDRQLKPAASMYISQNQRDETLAETTPTQVVAIKGPPQSQGRLLTAVYNQLLYDQLKSTHQAGIQPGTAR